MSLTGGASLMSLCSLLESHYNDNETFQDLKIKLIGHLEVVDIVESMTLYIKNARQLVQEVENMLANHMP